MKLAFPFIQLPLLFDAGALAAEIGAFGEDMWRAHPSGIEGNTALPLVAADGDPARGDALEGRMRPTPALLQSAYMQQVLGSLDAVLGRIRLMRLSGRAEVDRHIDSDYYWNERVRVHVPILTSPAVRFSCGDAAVNMAAGECWIFDTWRMHHVLNDADNPRIHLVVDTVGGAAFWNLVNAGRPHTAPRAGWNPRFVAPQPSAAPMLMFESVNSQSPMSYWELRDHVRFLLGEVDPQPRMDAVAGIAGAFVMQWQTLWFRFGADDAALPHYRELLDGYLAQTKQLAAGIRLRNGADFGASMAGLLRRAVRRPDAAATTEESARTPAASAPTASKANASISKPFAGKVSCAFDRPVFIVSPPRSGSTLLFETLALSPSACTIGGESHGVIEGIPALATKARGFTSNRLDAADASPDVIEALRERFRAAAFDRDGHPAQGRIRLLEKTPKNALRVPFLDRVFPDALFVYLHRDPRQVLASMMEAWESAGFRTYPRLPGWTGLTWSLLLTPGWRELIGRPLPDIVAAQWETATRILLDDLESMPPARWCVARYDALIADPAAEIARLCAAIDFGWDRTLSDHLPLARHTVSAPDAGKWRRREREIEPALARCAATVERAAQIAERH
ncbi:MAG TPA: sulfotransferase [Rhodanobacteraceae bacterium]|nr:sulfotransferase [Rhodanobacteraceae bacterium]